MISNDSVGIPFGFMAGGVEVAGIGQETSFRIGFYCIRRILGHSEQATDLFFMGPFAERAPGEASGQPPVAPGCVADATTEKNVA